LLLADLAQQEGRDDGRHKADADFGIAKFRIRTRKCKVAEQSESGSTGDRRSVHRSNGYLGELVQRAEQLDHGLRVLQVLLGSAAEQRLQVVEIHPGRKGFASPGHDQDDCI